MFECRPGGALAAAVEGLLALAAPRELSRAGTAAGAAAPSATPSSATAPGATPRGPSPTDPVLTDPVLTDPVLVGLVDAGQRLANWAAWGQLVAMAGLYERWRRTPPWGPSAGSGADLDLDADALAWRAVTAQCALTSGISQYVASARLATAIEVCTRLRSTATAMAGGEIDYRQVEAIATATSGLSDGDARAVEAAVLPHARGSNLPALRRAIADALARIDPAATRHRRAYQQRRVVCRGREDGMGEVVGVVAATDMLAIHQTLTALARAAGTPGDTRTLDQRRADVFCDLLTHPAPTGPASTDPDAGTDTDPETDADTREPADPGALREPTMAGDPVEAAAAGHDDVGPAEPALCETPISTSPTGTAFGIGMRTVRRELVVLAPLEVVTGASDAPGTLLGYGPIPAPLVRDFAATATWRCAATDRHGRLAALGTSTYTPRYRPTRPTDRHVRLRDQHCTFPGCHQPAGRCDLDHRIPHPGGPTCECNLDTLCRTHHVLKHRAGFTPDVHGTDPPDGHQGPLPPGTTWITPAGTAHHRPAVPPAGPLPPPPPPPPRRPAPAEQDQPPPPF